MRFSLNTWHRAALLLLAGIVALALLAWRVRHDPIINFLPGDDRAEWIIFPRPVYGASHPVVSLDTVFQREFPITRLPEKAELSVRAARAVELRINGVVAALPPARNWKELTTIDVAPLLKAGANRLTARVFNDTAPPALWLYLRAPDFSEATDSSWECSLSGSITQAAVSAGAPRFPGPGNPIGGGEEMGAAWRAAWGIELIFAAVAACLCGALSYLQKGRPFFFLNHGVVCLAPAVVLWVALFVNNAVRLPFSAGFDCDDHLKYINYLQAHRSLPWPNEGYEMFQAPLFYMVGAGLLSAAGLSTGDLAGVLLLRGLTMLCGVAQFVFVYLTVRQVVPRPRAAALIGLLLAAWLPMHLYLAHYPTNEVMAATFASVSIYLAVRLIRSERVSWRLCLLLGLVLGAALLTKATFLLLLPPLLLVVALRLWMAPSSRLVSLGQLLALLGVMLVVCGWYYARIWLRFGTPLVGNWDPATGFSWWQDPGYHVTGDYLRFGRSLVSPLFSGLNGFLDGIYSTLWGDALCAGSSRIDGRIPWNYNLVVCGYLMALIPTLLIVVGAAAVLRRFLRCPSLESALLLGTSGLIGAGVLFMTLRVACVGQIKAFYGLAAIVPICAFGAIGWDVLARRFPFLRWPVIFLLLLFSINSFAAVWIIRSTEQRIFVARHLRDGKDLAGALSEAREAVADNPDHAEARILLSLILEQSGHPAEATAQAERAVALSPSAAAGHLRLGLLQAHTGQYEAGAAQARRAIELGPEDYLGRDLLLFCLTHLDRPNELETIAREALAVSPFNRFIHLTLGLESAKQGDFSRAIDQMGYALLLNPGWDEAQSKLRLVFSALPNDSEAEEHLRQLGLMARGAPALLSELAWLRATSPAPALRNALEAVANAEEADRLTKHEDASVLLALAAAYAEANRFEAAIEAAGKARARAQAAADGALVARSEKLLLEFRAGHPYREVSSLK